MHKNFDEKMLLTFYRFSCEHSRFRKLAYFVSDYSTYVFFVIYFAVGYYLFLNRPKAVVFFIAVPLVNLIIVYALRAVVKRERPYVKLKLRDSFRKKAGYSFPSNHSASATIIAFACLSVNYSIGIAVFILAMITCLSRLFSAEHYPSDIAFGFIQSAVAAVIGFNIIPMLM